MAQLVASSDPARIGDCPPEIVGLVFEQLESDRGALEACTLVSRTWRALALPLFFEAIEVNLVERPNADFCEFLESCHNVAKHVRKVSLTGNPASNVHFVTMGTFPAPDACDIPGDVLLAALQCMPLLQNIVVRHITIGPPPARTTAGSRIALRSLTAYTLDRLSLYNLLSLFDAATVDICASIARTRTLQYDSVPPVPTSHPTTTARHLRLGAYAANALSIEDLQSSLRLDELHSLAAHTWCWTGTERLCAVIGSRCHRLVEVDLDFTRLVVYDQFYSQIVRPDRWTRISQALSHTSLRFARFCIPAVQVSKLHESYSVFQDLLSHLPPSLSELVIRLTYGWDGHYLVPELWDLAAVDVALSTTVRFPELARVTIEPDVSTPAEVALLEHAVVCELPLTVESGRLRFVAAPPSAYKRLTPTMT